MADAIEDDRIFIDENTESDNQIVDNKEEEDAADDAPRNDKLPDVTLNQAIDIQYVLYS